MSAFHIIQGGIDNGDWDWITKAKRNDVSPTWTVPKSAQPGDPVAIYVPTKGIVATAKVVETPQIRPEWSGRYGAKLTAVTRLDRPVELSTLKSELPDFTWLRYPRSITTPPADVSSRLENLMVRRSPDPSRPPTTSANRASTAYAGVIFEQLFPQVRIRKAAAQLLADALRAAASVTTAWTLVLEDDCVKLDVGPVQLMSFWPGSVLACATGSRRVALPSGWQDLSRGAMTYPNSVQVKSREYSIEASAIVSMPAELRNAILNYVRTAGEKRNGLSVWHYAHSGGVLAYLESFLGIRLPRPARSERTVEAQLLPDETPVDDFVEGGRIRVQVNVHERSAEARVACVEHWGTKCSICAFDFGQRYGHFAEGFIHVHHLKPLSANGIEHRVDAVHDLQPVCPNCHAAIHLGGGCRSIEEMKALVRSARKQTSEGRR